MNPTLYMVATPIGHLEDMTYRAVRVLGEVAVVYAEDTRVSRKLLDRYKIVTPLYSYREAAPRYQVEKMIASVLQRLQAGESVAYVSDAGTPGVSDPGSFLAERIAAAGFAVTPIPGASALASIMSVAGLPIERPLFVGFLPKKKGHQTLLGKLKAALESQTADSVIFYESPERISRLLQDLLEWDMPLEAVLGRELTKLHEEVLRGSLAQVSAEIASRKEVRGEIVLLVFKKS
jgi:16S rRNA (cytidine1402-2'-O)-methyltransferase